MWLITIIAIKLTSVFALPVCQPRKRSLGFKEIYHCFGSHGELVNYVSTQRTAHKFCMEHKFFRLRNSATLDLLHQKRSRDLRKNRSIGLFAREQRKWVSGLRVCWSFVSFTQIRKISVKIQKDFSKKVSTYLTFLDHSVMQLMGIVALCKSPRLARVVLRLIKLRWCVETEAKQLEDFAKRLQSYAKWLKK